MGDAVDTAFTAAKGLKAIEVPSGKHGSCRHVGAEIGEGDVLVWNGKSTVVLSAFEMQLHGTFLN